MTHHFRSLGYCHDSRYFRVIHRWQYAPSRVSLINWYQLSSRCAHRTDRACSSRQEMTHASFPVYCGWEFTLDSWR